MLHPFTPAPQLPCPPSFLKKSEFENESPSTTHRIRSSKKTQKIFFYSKSYVNSARLANQHSPIIKKSSASIRVPYQPSDLQLIVPTPDHLIA
jgi:hypothetical protein